VQAPMPRAITPMLATLVDEPFDDPQWLFEIKWDGYRAVAYLDGGDVRLVSRNQNDFTAGFPEVAKAIAEAVRAKRAVVDGEIVALDPEGSAPAWTPAAQARSASSAATFPSSSTPSTCSGSRATR
jgi:bifunctional non-homologous end joining protein LigD